MMNCENIGGVMRCRLYIRTSVLVGSHEVQFMYQASLVQGFLTKAN